MSDNKTLEQVFGAISIIFGQAPWASTVSGVYALSIYQPSIYRGIEPFLLVPLMVGVVSTWAVLRWPNAMWYVFASFIILSGFVYWAYQTFPPSSEIHPVNWILSYCAFALFSAALFRLIIDASSSQQAPRRRTPKS
jgi:hypothetical protein